MLLLLLFHPSLPLLFFISVREKSAEKAQQLLVQQTRDEDKELYASLPRMADVPTDRREVFKREVFFVAGFEQKVGITVIHHIYV